MGKHYCDYCDVFLTHDSTSVRKAHNTGRNHLMNVRDYYQSVDPAKAQQILDAVAKEYDQRGLPKPVGFAGAAFGGGGFGGPYGRPPPPGMYGNGPGMGGIPPRPGWGPPPMMSAPPPMGYPNRPPPPLPVSGVPGVPPPFYSRPPPNFPPPSLQR